MQFVYDAISDICEKNGLKYDNYFKLLQLADFAKLKHALLTVVRTLSRDQTRKELLIEKLQAMGTSPEISQVVATCLWVRKDEIHAKLVKDSIGNSQSRLDDFDWKLKVWQVWSFYYV